MGGRLALAGTLFLLGTTLGAETLACGPKGRQQHHMVQSAMPRAGSPGTLPQADSPGARLVGAYCTQCHGAPSPALHAPQEWHRVAQRMYRHMQRLSSRIYTPSDDEFATIVAYLESHAPDDRQVP